jgi:hypothetical protein
MPSLVPFQPALRALDLLLGWKDPWLPVDRLRGDESKRAWHRCGDGSALVTLVSRADELWSDELHLGLSERRRGGQPCGATALWARIEGPKELQRAHGFRPLPSVAVQANGVRWLIWPLDRWLGYFDVEERNRKIAYRLGATQKYGVPEEFRLPAPGSCLRVGRSRPVPVVCRRLQPVVFSPDQVTGRLKEPPAKYDWRQAG